MDIAQLSVVIRGDDADAEKKIKGINDQVKESGGFFKNALSNALGFAAGGAIMMGVGGAVSFLTSNMTDMVKSGMDANREMDILAAGLKSTHDASGMTLTSLDALSTSIMNLTGIDDDSTKAAEQMLLTFTGIGKTIFPAVTQAAADMATRMNGGAIPSAQQMQQQALLLGKAMNDPVQGMAALRREGVTFSDEQKKQITTMEKAGNVTGAQAIMLKELQKEFGGSAEAAGKANGGIAILSAQFDNLKQTLGQAIVPVLLQVMTAIQPITSQLSAALPGALAVVTPLFNNIWTILRLVGEVVAHNLQPAFDTLKRMFGDVGNAVKGVDFNSIIDTVLQLSGEISDGLNTAIVTLLPIIRDLATWFVQHVVPAAQQLATWFGEHVMPILQQLGQVIVTDILPALKNIAEQVMTKLVPALQNLWNKISPVLIPVFQLLGWIIGNVVGPVLGVLIGIIADVINIIATIIGKIGDFIGKLGELLSPIKKIGDAFGPMASQAAIHTAQMKDKTLGDTLKMAEGSLAHTDKMRQGILEQLKNTKDPAVRHMLEMKLQSLTHTEEMQKKAVEHARLLKVQADQHLADLKKNAFQHFGDMVVGVVFRIGDMKDKAIAHVMHLKDEFFGRIALLKAAVVKKFDDLKNDVLTTLADLPGKLHDFGANLIQKIIDGIRGMAGNLAGAAKDAIGGALHNIPGIGRLIPGFASGGIMPGGMALVGENGPELVVAPAGSRVYTASETANLMRPAVSASSGSGGSGGGYSGPQVVQIHIAGQRVADVLLPDLVRSIRNGTGIRTM
ncbi:MAG: phage tail protein [Ktedonobacterales bacterium]